MAFSKADYDNLIDQLTAELSRRNINYIAQWVGCDTERLDQLVNILFKEAPGVQMRASWVLTLIADSDPAMVMPYTNRIIENVHLFKHSGTRRNLLRYLASIEIPEDYLGELYDRCFNWLLSKDEPPAVKVHSMQILYNIANNLPDLKREIRLVIEELTNHESAAIRSRSQQLIRSL